ncbi:MAG: hypothetical protein ABEJ83_01030 [Candidatus Nanohaloarchaea archaeon]
MDQVDQAPGFENNPYHDVGNIFSKVIELENDEAISEFKERMDSLDKEDRYDQAMFIYSEELNESNSEKIQELKEDISRVPEWEFLGKYQEFLEDLDFLMQAVLRQARFELPQEVDLKDLVSDKLFEELVISLQGFKEGISEEDGAQILQSGNIYFNLSYALLKFEEEEFELEDICWELLESSKRLKGLGLENEISQRMLSDQYEESDLEIGEFQDRLRLERAFVIYKDPQRDISVSRAAEIAGVSHREFLEEAKDYEIVLKEG